MRPRSVMLVQRTLAVRGSTRQSLALAAHWVDRGHRVTVVTLERSEPPVLDLPRGVRWIALDAGDSSRPRRREALSLGWIRAVRAAITETRPDVIVGWAQVVGVTTLLARTGLRVPVAVSERIDWTALPRGLRRRVRTRLAYPRAAALVVQTEAARAWAERIVAPGRVHVIPNAVTIEPEGTEAAARTRDTPGRRRIVALGRLVPWKGHDAVIRAFARCAPALEDWDLAIYGDGPQRADLEQLADDLGVAARVSFPGFCPDVPSIFAVADLCILASRQEGFPNVLLESLVCGVPVIATDCRSGPREIVRDGVDGRLVPPNDPDALAAALLELGADEPTRRRLAARAPDVLERFGPAAVFPRWDEMLERL